MANRVIWSRSALQDLEEVIKYVSRNSPAYAATFALKAKETSRSLTIFARRGRVVPELNVENIRELFIHGYRLIYKIERSTITIIAFVHGKRKLKMI